MSPAIIAVVLGILFLVTALIKTIQGKRYQTKMERRHIYEQSGGLTDRQIYLTTPFDDDDTVKSNNDSASDSEQEKENPYLWD